MCQGTGLAPAEIASLSPAWQRRARASPRRRRATHSPQVQTVHVHQCLVQAPAPLHPSAAPAQRQRPLLHAEPRLSSAAPLLEPSAQRAPAPPLTPCPNMHTHWRAGPQPAPARGWACPRRPHSPLPSGPAATCACCLHLARSAGGQAACGPVALSGACCLGSYPARPVTRRICCLYAGGGGWSVRDAANCVRTNCTEGTIHTSPTCPAKLCMSTHFIGIATVLLDPAAPCSQQSKRLCVQRRERRASEARPRSACRGEVGSHWRQAKEQPGFETIHIETL